MTKAGLSPAGACLGWADDGNSALWTAADPSQENAKASGLGCSYRPDGGQRPEEKGVVTPLTWAAAPGQETFVRATLPH